MCTKNEINLGLIQLKANASTLENEEKTLGAIQKAAKKGAQIICLQELFKSPYFPQIESKDHFDLAEEVDESNPTIQKLQKLAEELKIVLIGGSFFEKAGEKYYNTSIVIDTDGSFLGNYRKQYIPEDPQFYEKYYFEASTEGPKTFKTKYAEIGVLICWDQWFPEAARETVLKGAQILFYPTAIGTLPEEDASYQKKQMEVWETIQRSHAIANGCFVATVNRVGFEKHPEDEKKGIYFWGSSFVAGPFGEILGKASQDSEGILVQKIDLNEIEKIKKDWPFFRDLKKEILK